MIKSEISAAYRPNDDDPQLEDFSKLRLFPRYWCSSNTRPIWETVHDGEQMNDDTKFTGVLRKQQGEMVSMFMDNTWTRRPYTGIAQCFTGFGKTITSIALAISKHQKTIVLVSGSKGYQQWKESISRFSNARVGEIQGGERKWIIDENVDFVIAMLPTLANQDSKKLSDIFSRFGIIIFDEVHCAGAKTFVRVLSRSRVKYQLGLSATPFARFERKFLIKDIFGPVVFSRTEMKSAAVFRVVKLKIPPTFKPLVHGNFHSQQNKVFRFISKNTEFNKTISAHLSAAATQNLKRVILVLSRRVNHLETLQRMLPKTISSGMLGAKLKKEDSDRISAEARVIFATFDMCKKAYDNPRVNCIFLVMDASNTIQSVGRIFRSKNEKIMRLIVDFQYSGVDWTARMAASRTRFYLSRKYVQV